MHNTKTNTASSSDTAVMVGIAVSAVATIALALLGYYGLETGLLPERAVRTIQVAAIAVAGGLFIFEAPRFVQWLVCAPVIVFNLAATLPYLPGM